MQRKRWKPKKLSNDERGGAGSAARDNFGGREGARTPDLLVANEDGNLTRRGVATTYAFRSKSRLGNVGNRKKLGVHLWAHLDAEACRVRVWNAKVDQTYGCGQLSFGEATSHRTVKFAVTRRRGKVATGLNREGISSESIMKGRKPKQESRAMEFRRELLAWKQIPEASRPSLRSLACDLGTSHQLLELLPQKPVQMGKQGMLAPGEGSSCPGECRGPVPDSMGRATSLCLQQGRRSCDVWSHVTRCDQAVEKGVRTRAAMPARHQSSENICSPVSGSAGALAEVFARRHKEKKTLRRDNQEDPAPRRRNVHTLGSAHVGMSVASTTPNAQLSLR